MIANGMKYGISRLPEDCRAYTDGYRYGAYEQDLNSGKTRITEFFKTTSEIQGFVNKHPEYGTGGGA